MLAYAPPRDRQRLRPATLALIIVGHAVVLTAVMSARMVVEKQIDPPIIVETIAIPKPPEAVPPKPEQPTEPTISTFTRPDPIIEPFVPTGPITTTDARPLPPLGPVAGSATVPTPPLDPPIVRTGPRFATADGAIRPPYPDSMRESGSETSLRLRLSIDARGRVIAVEPVGRADPTFLGAARRHILRAWRYQPAMEGAKAVPSTTTITLKFELGNA